MKGFIDSKFYLMLPWYLTPICGTLGVIKGTRLAIDNDLKGIDKAHEVVGYGLMGAAIGFLFPITFLGVVTMKITEVVYKKKT